MPHPWEITRGKPQIIQSLIEEERAFYGARITRGELDAISISSGPEATADSLAAEATITLPDVDLDGWTASMAEDSDDTRVTYTVPFRGDPQIVRLAIAWKSGGHAVTVEPEAIRFSIWSRDKHAAAIRAEAGDVLGAIGAQWREAVALMVAWNARARDELLDALTERQRFTDERRTLLRELNRHVPGDEAPQSVTPPVRAGFPPLEPSEPSRDLQYADR